MSHPIKLKKKVEPPREISEVLLEVHDDKIFVYLRDARTMIWSIPLKFDLKK